MEAAERKTDKQTSDGGDVDPWDLVDEDDVVTKLAGTCFTM